MEEFVPKKPDKEVISIRLSSELLQNVDRAASEAGLSRNELINQCISYALEHIRIE